MQKRLWYIYTRSNDIIEKMMEPLDLLSRKIVDKTTLRLI